MASKKQEGSFSKRLTPTEERILKVLEDETLHTYEELWTCLGDSEGGKDAVRMHLSNLRKKLEPKRTIFCVFAQKGKSSQYILAHLIKDTSVSVPL